jgi:hypothetical protein
MPQGGSHQRRIPYEGGVGDILSVPAYIITNSGDDIIQPADPQIRRAWDRQLQHTRVDSTDEGQIKRYFGEIVVGIGAQQSQLVQEFI